MSRFGATYYLQKIGKLPAGAFECPEKGCPKPRGERRLGFTGLGMKVHYARVHPHVSIDDKFLEKISADFSYAKPKKVVTVAGAHQSVVLDDIDQGDTAAEADYGTPGDEVVMGGSQRLIDDIRNVVEPEHLPPTHPAPVEPSNDEGVRVKARNGVLYVDGQPANLQAFIDGLRLAVRIS